MNVAVSRPVIDFEMAGFDPGDRFEAWRSLHDNQFALSPRVGVPAVTDAQARFWRSADLVFGRHRFGNVVGRRCPLLLRRHPRALLFVRRYRAGNSHAVVAGEPTRFGPGRISFVDFAAEMDAVHGLTDQLSVSVPHEVVGYRPGHHPASFSIAEDSALGRMLAANMDVLLGAAETDPAAEVEQAAEVFAALLRTILGQRIESETGRERFDRARLAALGAWVGARLGGALPKAAEACAALGLSRSVLYRLMEPEGGFERFVMRRRMDAAMALLLRAGARRGAVAAAAETFGFADQGHFSRCFHRRFGLRPSEVLGAAPPEEGLAARAIAAPLRPFVTLYG